MRTLRLGARFRKDFKRELRGPFRKTLTRDIDAIVRSLASDEPLTPAQREHALSGTFQGCRDCHVRPDLVRVYRKIATDILELVRLGSHSELDF